MFEASSNAHGISSATTPPVRGCFHKRESSAAGKSALCGIDPRAAYLAELLERLENLLSVVCQGREGSPSRDHRHGKTLYHGLAASQQARQYPAAPCLRD